MKILALAAVILAGIALAGGTLDFPPFGDPDSPASLHLSQRFIEDAYKDAATPNIVTVVLADYRSFDTMLETVVVLTAALACFFILRAPKAQCTPTNTYYRHIPTGLVVRRGICDDQDSGPDFERIDSEWMPQDVVISTVCRLLIPFIQLYGLYVIAHGHYSPGGGFQGGVIFAAGYLLLALSHDLRTLVSRLSEKTTHMIAAGGVLLFAGIGLIGLAGGNFLDYDGLAGALGMTLATGHSLGILLVEVGVGMTVTTALVIIFKLISSRGTVTEGL